MKSNYENQICQKQNICRTISLLNPIKKSLTRNASKNGLTYDITKNIDKEKERLNTLFKKKNNIFYQLYIKTK